LLLVVVLLYDRLGDIEAQGSQRRVPKDAEASGDADSARIGEANTGIEYRTGGGIDLQRQPTLIVDRLCALARAEQRSSIGKHCAAHAEIVWYQREREADLCSRGPERAAAERIARQRVTRTEARHIEAADGLATLVVEV